jgi:tetratricopeptide (TPR) repeat protein
MMIRTLFSKILFILSLLFFSSVINAQDDVKKAPDLKDEAAKSFESGNYQDALVQYKSLLQKYPKDGLYSYYCGLSLLSMNKEIPKAIEFLEFSSSKATAPYKVFYYLGDAYTRNYQFPEAKKAYAQFAAAASKSEEKEYMPLHLSEMSSNAVTLTGSYNVIDILASSLFIFSDSGCISQLRAPGGTLSLKPTVLTPTAGGINELSNLMFIPRNAEKGDLLFYAASGKNKKRGTDIYMVKALNSRKYSEPVAVDAINTEYDELMPYYDPVGKDLIFASKGHNSMGGFDLFKSHYDSERNSWAPPVNLGFPVNSPSDEYLMIPGTDMGNIMLITNRQGLDSMMTAYMLRIHEPRVKLAVADPWELKKIGNFGGIEAIPETMDLSMREILENREPTSEETSPSAPVNKHPKPGDQAGGMPADYNKYLKLALDQQFKADSLAKIAREARIRVKTISDPNERWAEQKNIISWEKGSADCQAKADEYYLLVKQSEGQKPEVKNIPDAIEKDTVINDITLYKYKQTEAPKAEPDTTQQVIVVPDNKVVTMSLNSPPPKVTVVPESSVKDKNQFEILGKSPYSESNSFPEDSNMPMGVYYKIQLAVKSEVPKWDVFGGISPVTFEIVEGKPLKKYFAGKFVNYDNAKNALEEVRRSGFPEAFIVSWYDGQKMTLNKVIELEKKPAN